MRTTSEDHVITPAGFFIILSLMTQVMAFYIEAVTRSAINGGGVVCFFVLEYIGIQYMGSLKNVIKFDI